MMVFKDIVTGAKLEVNNEFVVEQYKKYPDRYKEVKAEVEKNKVKK